MKVKDFIAQLQTLDQEKDIWFIYDGMPQEPEIEVVTEHNAVFPVALSAHFIENFADKSVLDLFGGTGTTLIAAEQLGRKCYMMELDPHYVSVILSRYIKFKGSDADVFLLKDGNKIPYNEVSNGND